MARVINADVHFAPFDLDAVVVGKGEVIAVNVGIPAEAAVDGSVAGTFDGVVPPFRIGTYQIVVPDDGAAPGPVDEDRLGPGGV